MRPEILPIPSLRDPSRAMTVRVVGGPLDPEFSEWWRLVWAQDSEEARALCGIHPELSLLLRNPVEIREVVVDQEDGIRLYRAACEVPGWPVDSPDMPAPLEFLDHPIRD